MEGFLGGRLGWGALVLQGGAGGGRRRPPAAPPPAPPRKTRRSGRLAYVRYSLATS